MNFSTSSILKPILSKLIALQSFFLARPRIDVNLNNSPDGSYGQRNLGSFFNQEESEPIQYNMVKYDFEFHWNYIITIKNNSSKTAYNIRIENIYRKPSDYIEKMDEITSLKEGESIELQYKLRHREVLTGAQAKIFRVAFPPHVQEIEIVVSYTNEARIKFYTRFIATKNSKINEHLIMKPKSII